MGGLETALPFWGFRVEEVSEFIGKTIAEFKFTSRVLEFTFKDGEPLRLYAKGSCCSSSWFEQISGEEALAPGAVVKKIEFIQLKDVIDNREVEDKWDYIQFYGVKFVTNKGYADVDMRNSSNGYYGGYITLGEDQYSVNAIYAKDEEEVKNEARN